MQFRDVSFPNKLCGIRFLVDDLIFLVVDTAICTEDG